MRAAVTACLTCPQCGWGWGRRGAELSGAQPLQEPQARRSRRAAAAQPPRSRRAAGRHVMEGLLTANNGSTATAGNGSCPLGPLPCPGYGDLDDGQDDLCDGSELRYGVAFTVVICVAYLAVFVIGVLGNVCVVMVVVSFPRMRSTTNLFIANLAIADLLVNVVCLPFTLVSNVLKEWVLGDAICRTLPYLQGVSVSASVYTLVCISVERCLAICWPLRCQLSLRTCRQLIAFVWAVSLLVTTPWAVFFTTEMYDDRCSEYLICRANWPSELWETLYFVLAHLSMCYLLPLACISVCYALIWRRVCMRKLPGEPQLGGQLMLHRSKMKAVKMLLVVVVSFALSWMPLYLMVSRQRFGPASPSDLEREVMAVLWPFAQWLGTSNSCVNPIFYAYFNRKFRAGFMTILSNHTCCLSNKYEYDQCSVEFRWQKRGRGLAAGALAGAGALVGVGAGPGPRRGSRELQLAALTRRAPARHLIARANTVCEVASAIPRCRVSACNGASSSSMGATLV
ncbi:Neuropeptide SIFamide receptor [Frankliniella fusca]|uniref:Neuropeptide SIFamide receptor n=1 Tax=Frankliniella fusca TaxID=407009 RepID=A0AAE1LAI5_9NEOP|nr:Neuropeptide SIFamide receptor [Frankliniella fusca]